MVAYGVLIDRVDAVTPLLGERERPLADRVVAICRALDVRPRHEGRLTPDASDPESKRELGRLTEQLGRRATAALPAATLGRAALADLHADLASFHRLVADCEAKLALLGH
jgi:hypothetical protein